MPWLDAPDEMTAAEQAMHANFELLSKLGVDYWCFHDVDICPEAPTFKAWAKQMHKIVALAKKLQDEHGKKVLWGTANLFSHPRFMGGAGTSPDPKVFAHAAAQIKQAMDATLELGGEGYTFWGGREGYETLLHTDMKRELDHLGLLLQMAVDYKKSIGFKGQFYIEPKPQEPTKHQYDFDAAACHAFLMNYGLLDHFKLNIETNHATLAGHEMHHELIYAASNGILGSIDANRGDLLLGWDTDQFPTDLYGTTLVMHTLLKYGGFTTGGLNFDAKLRRQSTDPIDLIYAHIGGMDAFARGLKIAAAMLADGVLEGFIKERYAGWDQELGQQIESGKMDLAKLADVAAQNDVQRIASGRQELIENTFNQYL
jgi:xylose isomerase